MDKSKSKFCEKITNRMRVLYSVQGLYIKKPGILTKNYHIRCEMGWIFDADFDIIHNRRPIAYPNMRINWFHRFLKFIGGRSNES